ncbi:hypothetical protein DSCO28_62270 [Desulfosarcina ovata subsp. sediminis]|uniref:ABC-type transport auxiliary lipoprotein component domain-containing protein n=2 Tax=Desulfosarcina ovata TaxID=83564 RepID=A0A5K7ZZT8_9BACT|nr:hypothetical protein DSCO28_62270 [Desulfosarcina ovata subsp. sediminis]
MYRMRKRFYPEMFILVLVILGTFACTKQSYINVTYQLPASSDGLAGRTVFIETRDLRSDQEIFNAPAKKNFEYFTGLFSLSLEKPDTTATMLGAYPLPRLFETAMKQRLAQLHVKVTDERSPNVPVFQIKINRFRINLDGQKWRADISYEANLSEDAHLVAREVVSGTAERVKIVGSGGAEKIIGEIFTEIINRLNVERLFQQAKL